jgi:hypothetical protein
MKLEKQYFQRDFTVNDRETKGTKRCRICQAIKPLTEFRALKKKRIMALLSPATADPAALFGLR